MLPLALKVLRVSITSFYQNNLLKSTAFASISYPHTWHGSILHAEVCGTETEVKIHSHGGNSQFEVKAWHLTSPNLWHHCCEIDNKSVIVFINACFSNIDCTITGYTDIPSAFSEREKAACRRYKSFHSILILFWW